jgi:hypothetical protein
MGAVKRDIDGVKDVIKEMTNHNFAVNRIPPTLDAARSMRQPANSPEDVEPIAASHWYVNTENVT